MSFFSSVLVVGTGFKGSRPKILFWVKGNIKLKVGQLDEQETAFLGSLFPVDSAFFA